MVTTIMKILYKQKTRSDISNPFNKFTHDELLKKANVNNFNDDYEIEHLRNGKILVKSKGK